MRFILLLITFLLSGGVLFGQLDMYEEDYFFKENQASVKNVLKKARKERKAQNYDDALGLYEYAVKLDSNNIHILYETATLADSLSAYVTASLYYSELAQHENRSVHPLIDFHHGKILQTLGQYDHAIQSFRRFQQEHQSGEDVSSNILSRANMYEEECETAKRLIREKPSLYSGVKNLGDPVNLKETSEFAPYYEAGELYFSRLKYVDAKQETRALNIFKHKEQDMGTNLAIKTDDQNAYLAMSNDGQRLYEISCPDLNKKIENRNCKIYSRKKTGENKWSDRKILPSHINLANANNTQPAIGRDKEENDILYFVSNREGGKGGMDIWMSIVVKEDNGEVSYSEPFNLEKINTRADEISPYYHAKCGLLYFSSDRKPSIGGFDIYQAIWNGYGWEGIESLGYPINSSFDDVDFFRNATGERAYFASKRIPENDIELERVVKGCCLDIYEAYLEMPVDLNITVYCGQQEISGANYTMEAMRAKGNMSVQDTSGILDNTIRIKANEEYQFNINKFGYTSANFDLLTNDVCEPTRLFERVYIRPLQNLSIDVQGKQARGSKTLDSLQVQIRDAEAGYLVDEGSNITEVPAKFSVEPGKDYNVYISREGYSNDTLLVRVPKIEESCTVDARAVLVPDLPELPLPVVLYFHNARPQIQNYTNLGTTNVSYKTTYDRYLSRIPEYKNGLRTYYLNRGEIAKADSATQRIDNFFEDQVKLGYEKLQLSAESLVKYLEKGESVSVIIRGTASPRASVSYNQFLSARRVNSVRNYLRTVNDGILSDYVGKELRVKEVPLGRVEVDAETQAKMDDDFGVYDPISAELRRVIIERIESDELSFGGSNN